MPYLIITEYMNQGDLKYVLQNSRIEQRLWPLKLKLHCSLQTAEGLRYLAEEKSYVKMLIYADRQNKLEVAKRMND
jgi:ATP sulfurylase